MAIRTVWTIFGTLSDLRQLGLLPTSSRKGYVTMSIQSIVVKVALIAQIAKIPKRTQNGLKWPKIAKIAQIAIVSSICLLKDIILVNLDVSLRFLNAILASIRRLAHQEVD